MSIVKVQGNASGTGTLTIAAPNTNSDRTLTLPDQTGTVLTNAGPFTANASATAGAVTIDASNNVGIGTSSPARKLHVSASDCWVSIQETASGNTGQWLVGTGSVNALRFYDVTTALERARIDSSGNFRVNNTASMPAAHTAGNINCSNDISTGSFLIGVNNSFLGRQSSDGSTVLNTGQANLIFSRGTYGSATESARIDSSGNFLVANGAVYFTSSQYRSNVASSQLQFINNGFGVSLAVNGTSWGSLSDERVKDIIEPISDAANKVSQLRAVIGKYKTDEEGTRRSFLIAQDVLAVLPEAVTVQEDEQGTMNLQYTELIPLLVASIKELKAEVDALKAQLGAQA